MLGSMVLSEGASCIGLPDTGGIPVLTGSRADISHQKNERATAARTHVLPCMALPRGASRLLGPSFQACRHGTRVSDWDYRIGTSRPTACEWLCPISHVVSVSILCTACDTLLEEKI